MNIIITWTAICYPKHAYSHCTVFFYSLESFQYVSLFLFFTLHSKFSWAREAQPFLSFSFFFNCLKLLFVMIAIHSNLEMFLFLREWIVDFTRLNENDNLINCLCAAMWMESVSDVLLFLFSMKRRLMLGIHAIKRQICLALGRTYKRILPRVYSFTFVSAVENTFHFCKQSIRKSKLFFGYKLNFIGTKNGFGPR